ncbi:MAG: multidrug efflux SMR transporter [Candidatus Methanomethylophilaceae archaeon]|jgi:quaternary ammonium compound-resistance protein SugE|nr:multidrug efflux SMR transporter [Candidatus Methanomethylophilaceae archaeon]MBR3477293.1 multidrug efflux SMR transporter [Candidatus Methanomethylophilaceae archaeon]MBR4181863.1 multidrug efflux SMR transporter [Candidatus Methanomethylophilaceae archaeon]
MNKAWLYILIGGMFETVWATTMDLSECFTDMFWTAVTIAVMPVSVIFLNKAMKMGLPTGPSYSVWVGIGAVGSVVVGMILFGEFPNLIGYACLALIIAGVIGLNLVTEGESA